MGKCFLTCGYGNLETTFRRLGRMAPRRWCMLPRSTIAISPPWRHVYRNCCKPSNHSVRTVEPSRSTLPQDLFPYRRLWEKLNNEYHYLLFFSINPRLTLFRIRNTSLTRIIRRIRPLITKQCTHVD